MCIVWSAYCNLFVSILALDNIIHNSDTLCILWSAHRNVFVYIFALDSTISSVISTPLCYTPSKKNSSLLHCQHIFKNIFSVCYQSTTLLRRPKYWHHVSPASLCWLAVERTSRCGLRGMMDIPHIYLIKTHIITLHLSDRHSLLIFLYIFLPYLSNIYFTYLKSIIYKRSIFLLCCL
jgi:hypothetical protein